MCVFRAMTQDDASIVFEIEKSLFEDPWPIESFAHDPYENEASFAFVAEKQSEVIGYIMGWFIKPEIHIGNIAVKKRYQRQGIGEFMIHRLFDNYFDYEICFLEVRESNHIAQKLYKKFGFKNAYIRRAYYANGEAALIMSKQRENM